MKILNCYPSVSFYNYKNKTQPINQNLNIKNSTSSNDKLMLELVSSANLNFYGIKNHKDDYIESINLKKELNKDVNYSDLEKYSAYLEKKFATSTKRFSVKNIEHLISKIENETGADSKLITEVLSRLTQYSSYSQLNDLSSQLREMKIEGFYDCGIGSNNALNYLLVRKNNALYYDLSKPSYADKKLAFVIDDSSLEYLKNISKIQLDIFKTEIKKGNIIPIQIDGWGLNCGSYNLLGNNKSLKNISIETIKEILNSDSKDIDKVLNGNQLDEFKKILGQENIKTFLIKHSKLSKNENSSSISKRMLPNLPSKFHIESVIETLVDEVIKPNDPPFIKERLEKYLAQYIDITCIGLSSQSITEKLKDKYKDIKKFVEENSKSMEDVRYIVPSRGKSFDLLGYQFCKTNNIPLNKIIFEEYTPYGVIYKDNFDKSIHLKDMDNKIFVIIDDIAASGKSLTTQYFNYYFFSKALDNRWKNSQLIFSPIFTTLKSEHHINKEIENEGRKNKDFLISNDRIKTIDFLNNIDNKYEKKLFREIIMSRGYESLATEIAFPYMLPDTNSRASSYMLCYFLNNLSACKSDIDYNLYSKINTNALKKYEVDSFIKKISQQIKK